MIYINPITSSVFKKLLNSLVLTAMVIVGLQALTACAASDPNAEGIQANTIQEPYNAEALRIINRPNRLGEEQAAWNPVPIPLEEFLHPKTPLKERYPTTNVDLPSAWEIGGLARWMDNRYLLITLSNPDIHPAKQKGISSRESRAPINERIYVLDSDTGNTYYLKTGRLECYWANQIVYITGTYDGLRDNSPYKNETYKWIGPLGQETRYSLWENEKSTTKHNEFTCQKMEAKDARKNIDEKTYFRTTRLSPEHGFLAVDRKLYEEVFPASEYAIGVVGYKTPDLSKVKGLSWYKPNGTRAFYPDVNFFDEVGGVAHYEWAPFLGRYAFSMGRSVTTDYRNYLDKPFKTVTLFSPSDGSIYKVILKRELDLLKTNFAHATRAGLLWGVPYRTDSARSIGGGPTIGVRAGPGLFLSQGEEFKQIANIGGTVVSPDGCRIFHSENKVSNLEKALGARDQKSAVIINFCKGD